MNRYLLVMLGAALGGLARYVVGTAIMQRFTARFPENVFPLGTVVVNVTGCFLIGILMSLFVARGDPNPRPAVVAGHGSPRRLHHVFQFRVGEL